MFICLDQWHSPGIHNGEGVDGSLTAAGGLEKKLPEPEARGSGGETPALDDFCNFSIKIKHFYAYFGQKSYFKSNNSSIKTI